MVKKLCDLKGLSFPNPRSLSLLPHFPRPSYESFFSFS